MRSHLLTQRTRSLVKTSPFYPRALLSSTHALRYPRKDTSQATPRLSKRASSSVTPITEHDSPLSPAAPSPADPPPEDADDKPKRKTRVSAASKDTGPSHQLPNDLDILWLPEGETVDPSSSKQPNAALPPPEILDEILHNFYITLHPQTQHRAAYASPSGPPIEPTFALYCPIEGGEYILDASVRELARQVGAEVVVMDSVQLAAGECGHFGKAASAFQLPENPLHFTSSQSAPLRSPPRAMQMEEDDDEDMPHFVTSSQMTLHVVAPAMRASRLLTPSRNSSMSKLKAFFDELVNLSPPPGSYEGSADVRRPRIIYIRDFATLAASSSIWYPALVAAVRQRRQGPISRPTSPVLNPTTIIFGITPSIVASPSSNGSQNPGPQGMMNFMMSRHPTSSASSSASGKAGKSSYGEDAASDKARERRMLQRLKRWARGDASQQDLPQLSLGEDGEDNSGSSGRPHIVMVGGPDGMSGLPSSLGSALAGSLQGRSRSGPSEPENRSKFFRTSIIVPTTRSPADERASRMARRREINELTMRMGIAAVGGQLGKMEPVPEPTPILDSADASTPVPTENGKQTQMWEDWGKRIEVWTSVRRIADRAVGSVIAAGRGQLPSSSTLESTPIPWSAIHNAWATDRSTQELWKSLLLEPPGRAPREHDEDDEGKFESADEGESIDEVIEKVKRDPDLDQHEQRLLGCIVDASSLSTTFSQVHLPDHTIDSVRTIVSLPLLYPAAFQQGILKEHGMTGCLLFGPPGTGKTLVVRALAREAGCRMLAISPSDVMDMYVGEGEKLVRSVFSLARRLSPCVVFIDELDALFGARVSRESGGGIAHRGVITEFMQEMDGLKSSKDDNLIVIGATNRPFDLDDAVLRRLPRRLLVDLPGEKEREAILKILLRDEQLAQDVDLKALAKKTESFSGSDLKHLCVSAALDAVKEHVDVPWRSTSSFKQPAPVKQPAEAAEATAMTAEEHADSVDPSLQSNLDPSESQAPAEKLDASTEPSDPAADSSKAEESSAASEPTPPPTPPRVLASRNFDKALKEITPSASESLGSLAELRKWNDEFGEGRKERKKQVWGKGRFGFMLPSEKKDQPGKVESPAGAGQSDSSVVG